MTLLPVCSHLWCAWFCFAFHLSTRPLDALNSTITSIFAKSVAFSWRANPLTDTLLNLADINHLMAALSNDSYFPAFFLFKLIFWDENAAIIFSLLAAKSHVEIVLLGIPYFWATNDLICMEVRSFCYDLDMSLSLLQRRKKLYTIGKNLKRSNFEFIFKFSNVPFFHSFGWRVLRSVRCFINRTLPRCIIRYFKETYPLLLFMSMK